MSVQELNNELTTTNKDLIARVAKYEERDEAEKMELLEKLPEEDREDFSNLSNMQLKKVINKLTQPKPETLKEVYGAVKAVKMDKPYMDMNDQERRQWHTQILNSNK